MSVLLFPRKRQCCFSPKVLALLLFLFFSLLLSSLLSLASFPPLVLQFLSSVSLPFFSFPNRRCDTASNDTQRLEGPTFILTLSSSLQFDLRRVLSRPLQLVTSRFLSLIHYPTTLPSRSGTSATVDCTLLATLLSAPFPALYHHHLIPDRSFSLPLF